MVTRKKRHWILLYLASDLAAPTRHQWSLKKNNEYPGHNEMLLGVSAAPRFAPMKKA